MKECCKTGDVPKKSKFKKFVKWFVYLFLIKLLSLLLFSNLFEKSGIN
jgi:hypothetical protein